MFESIVEAVADYAAKNPDKLCVADKSGAYTYGEIWKKTKIAAQKLQTLGIEKKDFVMAECTQEADYVICDLACEYMGAVFVPVEHRASEDRVRTILEETNARLFLCSSKYEAPVTMMELSSLTEAAGRGSV